jgi:hypothetical protein
MRRKYTRIVATLTALAAGALAAYALRPAPGTTVALAARNPAVEVRTEVIRRTIHIVKHVPGAGAGGYRSPMSGHRGGYVRTGASRLHSGAASGASPGVVSTHVSGSHASAGGTTYAAAPVTTHTSGSHGASSGGSSGGSGSSGGTVRTSTSGSKHGSGSSGGPVHTRTSGGHGGDGGDGGGGGGGD